MRRLLIVMMLAGLLAAGCAETAHSPEPTANARTVYGTTPTVPTSTPRPYATRPPTPSPPATSWHYSLIVQVSDEIVALAYNMETIHDLYEPTHCRPAQLRSLLNEEAALSAELDQYLSPIRRRTLTLRQFDALMDDYVDLAEFYADALYECWRIDVR